MARPIDEKIVAMKMDNSDFKRKATETVGLFGKLKNSLAGKFSTNGIDNVGKSLGGIQKAANNTDLSNLGRAADAVASRFSNLGVVATTALVNISNRITDTALNMYQRMTVAPIMDGFREYETKMGSIQTILANTQSSGTNLGDVKRNLEALNSYADKTIYNFAEMTRNIGFFTNAGLELDESTSMIKGFSNAAAASGANSEQAGRAAYQMSQGLAQGYLMQMDWMSLTNAGMGNDNMKRDLIAIGKAKGTLDKSLSDDAIVKDWKSLLTDEEWLTSDVMSTYLQAMAGDLDKATLKTVGLTDAQADLLIQNAKTGEEAATKVRTLTQLLDTIQESIGSSWATSFELIFGDFEQATKLWTGINDAISPIFERQGKARNKLLAAVFRDGKGLENSFGGLKNILTPIGQIFGAIGNGFRKAFPPTNVSALSKFLETFKKATEIFKLSEGSVKSLSTIFEGFFSIFALGWKVVKGGVAFLMALIPSFEGVGERILSLVAKIFKIPIAMNRSTSSAQAFKAVLDFLLVGANFVASGIEALLDVILDFADHIEAAWAILSTGDFQSGGPWNEDDAIVDRLLNIRDAVVDTVGTIKEVWSIFTKGDYIGTGPWDEDSKIVDWMFDVREGAISMAEGFGEIEWSLEPVVGAFTYFFESVANGWTWLKETVSAAVDFLADKMPTGDQLFAGGILAAFAGIMGFALKLSWDVYQLFNGWTNIVANTADVLEGVGDALNAFTLQVRANALLTLAIAIGILAVSLLLIANLKMSQIAGGLYAISVSMAVLVGALAIMSKYDIAGAGMSTAAQIVGLSIAFFILAGALKLLSSMSWGEITKGLFGLIGVLGTFSIAIAVMSKFGGSNLGATAFQLLAVAGAIYILMGVVKRIGELDTGVLVKGVAALGVILAQLALFVRISGASKISVSTAVGVLALAGAIVIIVQAIKMIADIDVKMLAKGLITITIILAALAGFSMLTGNGSLLAAGAGVLLIAVALNLLLVPVLALGSMDLKTLGVGLGAIALALVAIGLASMLMTGAIAAGAGIVLIAIGLHLLIVPIAALGNMSWKTILTGIFGLALAMGVLGGVAALLGLAAPAMLAFVGVLALASVAMALAGLGMSLFSTGLLTLATMSSGAITVIIATLTTLIVGLASLTPMFVNWVGNMIILLVTKIAEGTPIIAGKFYEMILAILNVFADNLPAFVEVAARIITGFLDAMAEALPQIVESATNLAVSFIEALAVAVQTNGPRFKEAVMVLMAEILVIVVETGIAVIQALFGWIPGVTEATNAIGEKAESTIRDAFGAAEVGSEKGDDFSGALANKAGAAESAGSKVAGSAESGTNTVNLDTIGSGAGAEFASGLISKRGAAETSGSGLASAGKTGASSISLTSTGSNFGLGFASGIGSQGVLNSVVSAGKSLARKAKEAVAGWLGIASPSRLMKKDGAWFSIGFAEGISNMAGKVADSAKGVAQTAHSALNEFLGGFEIPVDDNEIHFRAVVDYDGFDPRDLGGGVPVTVQPDTAMTRGLVTATRAELRQNAYNRMAVNVPKSTTVQDEPVQARQPIVIQTRLNSRIIAEETIEDISKLQNIQQMKIDRARGEY